MILGQKKGGPYVHELYEEEIIQYLAIGLNRAEIAQRLPMIEVHHIANYLVKIKKKWRARNLPHLIHLWHLQKSPSYAQSLN